MKNRSNEPALGSVVVLTLAGVWMATAENTHITLEAANGQTTLTAYLIDGLPQEIALDLNSVRTTMTRKDRNKDARREFMKHGGRADARVRTEKANPLQ